MRTMGDPTSVMSRAAKLTLRIAAALCICAAAPPAQESLRPWPEYQVLMWTGDSPYKKPEKLPLFWQRMREMGVTAGMVHGEADPAPVLAAKMPYYLENIVNKGLCLKWNSQVADWDKWVTAWKGPRDEAGLVREYSFDDPTWRTSARDVVQRLVKRHAPHAPLLYDIRDEISVTMSANPFDFDFSAPALMGFRVWLKTRYASLAALNAEWETSFAAWEDVKPFTTDQIKNRMASGKALPTDTPDWSELKDIDLDPAKPLAPITRWNFAPWCDFRTYMDISLAAVLADLRRAARALDPKTPVGIEGTQMPSAFGGYDLWRLAQVIDWVEPYDIGDARAILGSFMPGKLFLTTVAEQDARAARRRLWHLLLEGDRGCFIWWSEDCIDWESDDCALTPRAQALAPVLAEMRSPLARLFMRAEREIDPIAIHYSQASIQVAWLLDSAVDGSTWLRRFSSYEAEHSRFAKVRAECSKRIEDAGYTPRFVSTAEIETGALKDFHCLVLPSSYAMSDAEVSAVSAFAKEDRCRVDFDRAAFTALFDDHGRMRPQGASPCGEIAEAHDVHGQSAEDWRKTMRKLVPLAIEVPAASEVKVQRYRLGDALLIALERNVGYTMGEDLKQRPVAKRLEEPVSFDAHLATKAHVYDLRTGKYLGLTDSVHVALDPWQPALLALTAQALPEGDPVSQLSAQADSPK
jgi:hypothetical protein